MSANRPWIDLLKEEVGSALVSYDDARERFAIEGVMLFEDSPLAVEVWVYDRSRTEVQLVRHRWRGWVPPGGRCEPGESPREAAERELLEETGLDLVLVGPPYAVTIRRYTADREPSLGLSYAAAVDKDLSLVPEAGQPVRWWPLSQPWDSWFPDDQVRMHSVGTHAGWWPG